MARPREFEIDDAIEGAMNVFWERGYDGASLPDLLEGMGITRGSLYKAFNDKKTVYLKALQRYEVEAVCMAVDLLTGDGVADGRARIEQLFGRALATAERGDMRGCLLCNAAAGAADADEDIARRVHDMLEQIEDALDIALAASERHAEMTAEARRVLASLLMAQYTGVRILTRSRAPLASIRRAVAGVSVILEGGGEPSG